MQRRLIRVRVRWIFPYALAIALGLAVYPASSHPGETGTPILPDSSSSSVSTTTVQQRACAGLKLESIDGRVSTLGDYLSRGPVYVNFWAIWCEPCKQELRALKKFVEEHGEESFTIIAANIDNPKSLAKVKAYVRSQSYAFPVILDPNQQFFQFFNGQRLPFGILLDGSGKVVTTRTSYLPGDEKEIGREILELVEP